jgi:hypothetical protein
MMRYNLIKHKEATMIYEESGLVITNVVTLTLGS